MSVCLSVLSLCYLYVKYVSRKTNSASFFLFLFFLNPRTPTLKELELIFKPLQCTCPFSLPCWSFRSQQRPNLLSPAGSSLFDTILYDKSLCQLDLGRKKKKKAVQVVSLYLAFIPRLCEIRSPWINAICQGRAALCNHHTCAKSEPDCFPLFLQGSAPFRASLIG